MLPIAKSMTKGKMFLGFFGIFGGWIWDFFVEW
jgi:hypothetical protein